LTATDSTDIVSSFPYTVKVFLENLNGSFSEIVPSTSTSSGIGLITDSAAYSSDEILIIPETLTHCNPIIDEHSSDLLLAQTAHTQSLILQKNQPNDSSKTESEEHDYSDESDQPDFTVDIEDEMISQNEIYPTKLNKVIYATGTSSALPAQPHLLSTSLEPVEHRLHPMTSSILQTGFPVLVIHSILLLFQSQRLKSLKTIFCLPNLTVPIKTKSVLLSVQNTCVP